MTCQHPRTFDSGNDRAAPIVLPCGSCLACRIQKAKEWAVRCVHESAYWESSSFITLTYDDAHLPESGSLVKEDLQKFMKRLRKAISPRKMRYYAAGEYGEIKYRPHYHMIAFGIGPKDYQVVKDEWSKGFVYFRGVGYESAKYVADYVGKGDSQSLVKWLGPDRIRPFKIMSQGLGREFADQYSDRLRKRPEITIRGVHHRLPKYYAKRVGITSQKLMSLGGAHQSKLAMQAIKKLQKLGRPTDYESLNEYFEEITRNRGNRSAAALKLKKKGKA